MGGVEWLRGSVSVGGCEDQGDLREWRTLGWSWMMAIL